MAFLDRVSMALDSPAAQNIILQPFRAAGRLSSTSPEIAGTCASLQELLSSEYGIKTSTISDEEITTFVLEAKTKDAITLTSAEYQELMTTMVTYAALKARRSPGKRWSLGFGLSAAAGAVAVGAGLPAAAAVSSGLLVAAAVGLDGRKASKRDRKRAARHIPRPQAAPVAAAAEPASTAAAAAEPAAPAAAEIASEPAAATTTPSAAPVSPAAPAPAGAEEEAAPLESCSSGIRSEELVSAVVEVVPPPAADIAVSPFKDGSNKDVFEAADITASSLAVPITTSKAAAVETLPVLVPSASPVPAQEPASPTAGSSGSVSDAAVNDHIVADVAAAQLPPLKSSKSGTKKLKKSLSKGLKSFKKAISLSSSTDLDAAAAAAVAAADGGITAPSGKPPSGGFFRRSFSKDVSSVPDAGLTVQASEGSATVKKMKEVLRRSFSRDRPSMDGGSRVSAF